MTLNEVWIESGSDAGSTIGAACGSVDIFPLGGGVITYMVETAKEHAISRIKEQPFF